MFVHVFVTKHPQVENRKMNCNFHITNRESKIINYLTENLAKR